EVLSTTMSLFRTGSQGNAHAVAIQPTPLDDRSRAGGRTARKRAAMLAHVGRYEFDPKGFAVIEGEPIVYWWTTQRLALFAKTRPLKTVAPSMKGICTGDNT